jgi:hypothetical protein
MELASHIARLCFSEEDADVDFCVVDSKTAAGETKVAFLKKLITSL